MTAGSTRPQRAIDVGLELDADDFELTTFANDGAYDELVLVRDIAFRVAGAPDRAPLSGVAHVAFVPRDRLVGPADVAALVDHIAQRVGARQQLSAQVLDALTAAIDVRGAGVVVETDAGAVSPGGRGVRSVTTALAGTLYDAGSARAEFLSALRR